MREICEIECRNVEHLAYCEGVDCGKHKEQRNKSNNSKVRILIYCAPSPPRHGIHPSEGDIECKKERTF